MEPCNSVPAMHDDLIDAVAGTPACDAAAAYTQHIPVRVIAYMLGIPEEEGDRLGADPVGHPLLVARTVAPDHLEELGEVDRTVVVVAALVVPAQLRIGDGQP